MKKLKANVNLALAATIALISCKSEDNNQPALQESLQFGVENPVLLPQDKAHSVVVNLRPGSIRLETPDILAISNLVARVPALRRRQLELITPSTSLPGSWDVWVSPFVIRVKRDPEWAVVRVDSFSP
jgi:hypothetical protein